MHKNQSNSMMILIKNLSLLRAMMIKSLSLFKMMIVMMIKNLFNLKTVMLAQ
jgi:hypothetical protein